MEATAGWVSDVLIEEEKVHEVVDCQAEDGVGVTLLSVGHGDVYENQPAIPHAAPAILLAALAIPHIRHQLTCVRPLLSRMRHLLSCIRPLLSRILRTFCPSFITRYPPPSIP